MTTINDVWDAFEEARGRWIGCNWRTHYGSLGLDLDGVSSSQAHLVAGRWLAIATDEVAGDEVTAEEAHSLAEMALHLRMGRRVVCRDAGRGHGLLVCNSLAVRFCAGLLAREWEFAASWLLEVEADAHWAQEEAQEAVRAAEDSDWEHALGHARQACLIESSYYAPHPWTRLQLEIEGAIR